MERTVSGLESAIGFLTDAASDAEDIRLLLEAAQADEPRRFQEALGGVLADARVLVARIRHHLQALELEQARRDGRAI